MTDKYGVIGNPIAHSKSPQIHKMFAEQTGQDITYEPVLAPLDGFAATVERLRQEGYKGCNVTVPFKFEAFRVATTRRQHAELAQAVNTLTFTKSGIEGDNTDGVGLVRDIIGNLGLALAGKKILLVGAGGAAWGVALPLLQEGGDLTIANRTVDKARELAQALDVFLKTRKVAKHSLQFGIPALAQSFAALSEKKFDVVINATSSGLSGEMPPLPPGIFAHGALAYEMMYGRETPFMTFARQQGAGIVSDGLGMLVGQAAESFFIWRGVRPDTRPILEALRGT